MTCSFLSTRRSLRIFPSIVATLVCLVLSLWLPKVLTLTFDGGLIVTTMAIGVICLVMDARDRRPRKLHIFGRFRLVTMTGAIAVHHGSGPASLAFALALMAGIQCGFALGALGVRLLRTRWRLDLAKRIADREGARRSRSFRFGRGAK